MARDLSYTFIQRPFRCVGCKSYRRDDRFPLPSGLFFCSFPDGAGSVCRNVFSKVAGCPLIYANVSY